MRAESVIASVTGAEIAATVAARFSLAAYRLRDRATELYGPRGGTVVSDLLDTANRLHSCRKSIVYKQTVFAESGEKAAPDTIEEIRSCSAHKYCPICSDVQYSARLKKMAAALKIHRPKYCYLLTFTQKTQTSAADASREIMQNFRRWIRAGQARSGGSRDNCESAKITGAIKSLEVKLSAGKFHAHIHAVVFTNAPIDFAVYDAAKKREAQRKTPAGAPAATRRTIFKKHCYELGAYLRPATINGKLVGLSKLTEEWYRITGSTGLDCRPVPLPDYTDISNSIDSADDNTVLGKIRYSLKYSVKPGDILKISDIELFELFDSMRGVRTVEFLGFFRNQPKPETEREKTEEHRREKPELPPVIESWHYCRRADSGEVETTQRQRDFEIYGHHREEVKQVLRHAAAKLGQYRRVRTAVKRAYQSGEIRARDACARVHIAKNGLKNFYAGVSQKINAIIEGVYNPDCVYVWEPEMCTPAGASWPPRRDGYAVENNFKF